jgi:hypothetical protein
LALRNSITYPGSWAENECTPPALIGVAHTVCGGEPADGRKPNPAEKESAALTLSAKRHIDKGGGKSKKLLADYICCLNPRIRCLSRISTESTTAIV